MATMVKVKESDLVLIRERSHEFMAKWKARGRDVTVWKCPHCKKPNEARVPLDSEVSEDEGFWSSAITCIECGTISGLRVYPDKRTVVVNM